MSNINLSGGVFTETGRFYLLIAEGNPDDDLSRLARGRREGNTILLEPLSARQEFVSIDALSSAWRSLGEVAALTAEGALVFAGADGSNQEIVTGSGYSRKDSRRLGRMTTIRECGDYLYAMGFGGQVYRRVVGGAWEAIGPEDSEAKPPSYYTVAPARTASEFVFGGAGISEYSETDEIRAAEEAGDASRLADLILDSIDADALIVSLYSGAWDHVDVAGTGAVGPILRITDGWLIFVSTGLILKTSDFSSFSEVYAPTRPTPFQDVKVWSSRPIILMQRQLLRLDPGGMVPFDPSLPLRETPCLSLWPSAAGLAAVHRDAVLVLRDDRWETLGLRLA
jgi:hypothetical protein